MVYTPQLPIPGYTYTVYPLGDGTNSIAIASPQSNLPNLSGASATLIGNVFTQLGTAKARSVFFSSGDYKMGLLTPAVTIPQIMGLKLVGEAVSLQNSIGGQTGVRFLAGVANQTIFGPPPGLNQFYHFVDLGFDTNGFTGIKGMDLTGAESSTGASVIERCRFNQHTALGVLNGTFSTALILDGNEDLEVKNCSFDPGSTVAQLHWDVPLGNIMITNPFFGGATSPISIIGKAQTARIFGGTVNAIQLSGAASGVNEGNWILNGIYFANPAIQHVFDLNGFNLQSLHIQDCDITVPANKNLVNVGAGVLSNFDIQDCKLAANAGSKITDTLANFGVNRLKARGTRVTVGTFAGIPWTVDNNTFLSDPGFITTTPAVPATGVAQKNTNPYPVRIYFLTVSAVTFTLTDPGGTVSASITGSVGQEVTLGPGESITPTYTTLTWKWYGVNE